MMDECCCPAHGGQLLYFSEQATQKAFLILIPVTSYGAGCPWLELTLEGLS